MDKRFAVTVLAVALVTAGSAALATLKPEVAPETVPLGETVSGVEQPARKPPEQDESVPDYAYIIREYEGKVAVFSAESPGQPEIVFDTLVKYLPDYDQTQMRQGIPVEDYKTLVSLIEDYIS